VEHIRLANEKEIDDATGAPLGFVGPVGLKKKLDVVADHAVMSLAEGVSGANERDRHLKHVVPGRDFKPKTVADLRYGQENDVCGKCGKGKLRLIRAMEIGHVFKLGTKYADALEANYLDDSGKRKSFIMGCYGIGVNRILAGAIEQHHDDKGIVWPDEIAPFSLEIVTVNESHEESRRVAEELYRDFSGKGMDVLYDNRNERAGVKFNDADLIGIPRQLIVGERNLKKGCVELKRRKDGSSELVPLEKISALLVA